MAKWILTHKTPLLCDMKRFKIKTTVYKTNVVLKSSMVAKLPQR